MQEIDYTVHIFKAGDTYVAYVPELNVSSCGTSDGEACKNIRDAVEGLIETSRATGTLSEILEESGYAREGDAWRALQFVSFGRMKVSVDGLG